MFPTAQPTSSSRLITLNLLFSSSRAETDDELRESSIDDLSTLINLVALYDELFVLNTVPGLDTSGNASDLIRLLNDEQLVKTQELNERTREEISQRAKKHLGVYHGESEIAANDRKSRRLSKQLGKRRLTQIIDAYAHAPLEAYTDWVLESYAYFPAPFDMMDDDFAALDNIDAFTQETTLDEERHNFFYLRAFLYLSYAHLLEIPFTPDHDRATLIKAIVKQEDAFFRTRILSSLQKTFETFPPSFGDSDYRRMISPFAAVVFQRCNGRRSRLATEIKKIRDEMKPTRQRLRELEWHAIWDSRAEGIKAENKLRKVLDEIDQNFGPQPGVLTWETGISLGKESAEIIDNQTSLKAWLEGLLHLPIDAVTRLTHRRPVAEIHRLQKELPSSRALNKVLYELFGELKK